MSSFFSIGGRRGGQSDDRSDSNNHLGGDGEDDPHVPPREISFWYDRADHHTHGGFVEPCHHHQQQQQDLYSYSPSRMRSSTRSMDGCDGSRMVVAGGYGGGGVCCQECGNGAKKECVHQRCRTCCQSRGFDCPTHVKSTWVPAGKRRERQQQLQQQQQQQLQLSSSHQVLAKRRQPDDPAGAGSTSLACVGRGRSGLEAGSFPAEVNSPAMFRCVCVSSADEREDHDQYAYQTAVNIGGHLFKGILYDQGPDHIDGDVAAGESSSGGGSGGVTQPLRLGGPSESESPASATLIDPYSSSLYPSSFNFYNAAGTQFFPHPRS